MAELIPRNSNYFTTILAQQHNIDCTCMSLNKSKTKKSVAFKFIKNMACFITKCICNYCKPNLIVSDPMCLPLGPSDRNVDHIKTLFEQNECTVSSHHLFSNVALLFLLLHYWAYQTLPLYFEHLLSSFYFS